MAGHCMRPNLYQFIQIFFDCLFVLENSHRLMHDIRWHAGNGDRFGCSLFVCNVKHMRFDWIITLPDFINFSANLSLLEEGRRKNGRRVCHQFDSKYNSKYENPSTVMFAIAAHFYRCWLVFVYIIISEWRRWTFLYPLLINLYFSSLYQGSICLMLRARQFRWTHIYAEPLV